MQHFMRGLLCLFTFLTATTSTFALETKLFAGQLFVYERSEKYESILGGAVTLLKPYGNDEFERPDSAILIEGVLSRETLAHVRRLMKEQTYSGVYLDSPGGDLNVGIALGRLLRDFDDTAIVPRNGQCKSACALAFIGAAKRFSLGDPGALGFHRQYRIIDGKIAYGSLDEDKKVIDSYLKSISFGGITAEEIATTTGQVTFSESSLKERGLISLTRNELQNFSKQLVTMSGFTRFEVLSVICSKYDGANTKGASLEVITKVIICKGRVPAVREPMLLLAWSPLPFSQTSEMELLSDRAAMHVLRSSDATVVDAFNLAADEGSGKYEQYRSRRQSVRDTKAPAR